MMSSDLTSVLQLDSKGSKVITVKEINSCDSSFIISCVLHSCIRNKNAILFVSTHNSLQHYHQVGLRMNYNLQNCVDRGLIVFYNLGEKIVEGFIENQQCSLQQYFSELEVTLTELLKSHKSVNIIVEGISHLFDFEYSLKDVNSFCSNLIKLSRRMNDSFVFIHCNIACNDDITCIMANLLSHKATTILEVENLPTGWSADVSGHLTIKQTGLKFLDEHMFNLEQKSLKYLFKLFDRGVKLFAPGTV